MLKAEELFERIEAYQNWARQWVELDFWQALYGILFEIACRGGANIEYNGKVYSLRTSMDAIKLLLDIYRDEICKEAGSGATKSL